MRSSMPYFDRPIPLSRLRSWWHAWVAVLGKVFLDDYLIHKLRDYQAYGRHSRFPLPFVVVIQQGKLIKIPNPEEHHIWEQLRDDPTGEDAGELFQTQTDIQENARALAEIEDEHARLSHAIQLVREQQEVLEAEKVEAIGRGEEEGPTTRKRHTQQRPRLPFPWLPLAGYLALGLMMFFEAYQLGLPFLDLMGVDTTTLPREWHSNPLGVLNGAGFALAATAGLFFLWHLLVRSAIVLNRSWDAAAPLVLLRRIAGIFVLCCSLCIGTILIAHMRHGMTHSYKDFEAAQHDQSAGLDLGTGVFLFLTLLVPFMAACLHHSLTQSAYWQRRRDIADQQAQWDQDEDARLVPAEAFADRMAILQHTRARLEQQHTRLQQERSALAERARTQQQQRHERLEHARRCTQVYAQTLLAALEQDRQYFLRAAHRCQAIHLVTNQAGGQSTAGTRPPRQFVHALLPAAKNGHGS